MSVRLTMVKTIRVGILVCFASFFAIVAQAQPNPAQTLQRTRDAYLALKSYSDFGVLVHEFATSSHDRHAFTTYFNRAPRGFLLDFRQQAGDRYVIWGDPDAFHTWWQATDQRYDYPNPNNVAAFSGLPQAAGAALKVPTLLYGRSTLAAKMLDIADPLSDGFEDVSGHRCYRITGQASDVYAATGKEVNVHRVTVWIDAESFLVRKMLEEWKTIPGQRWRDTTTFEPQANPALDASRFKFAPPVPKR